MKKDKTYEELLKAFKAEVLEVYEADNEDPEVIESVKTAANFREAAQALREEIDEGIDANAILLWAWFGSLPIALNRALTEIYHRDQAEDQN